MYLFRFTLWYEFQAILELLLFNEIPRVRLLIDTTIMEAAYWYLLQNITKGACNNV